MNPTIPRRAFLGIAVSTAWFRLKPAADGIHEVSTEEPELRAAMAAE